MVGDLKINLCTAEGQRGGLIEILATVGSIIVMILTFPISVFICFKGKENMSVTFYILIHHAEL